MLLRFLYIGYRIFAYIFRPLHFGVRVMMVRDGKVFLVRQSYRHGWFMPGGGLKRGETIEQAARREAREESGAELGEMRLIGIYTSFPLRTTDHNALFACDEFEFTGRPDGEIAESGFFSLDDLPQGLMSGHRRIIEAYLKGENFPPFGEW